MFHNLCGFILIIAMAHGFPSENNDQQCLNYCSNDGKCVIEDGVPRCDCLLGWQGERCNEVRVFSRNVGGASVVMSLMELRTITPCVDVPNPCENGGFCVINNGEYACACPEYYLGDVCEKESVCKGACANGGKCTDTNGKAECDCKGTGYEGPACTKLAITTTTTATTTTITNDPGCKGFEKFCNGQICSLENGKPKCNCPPNTVEPLCKPTTQPTQSTPPPSSSSSNPPGSSSASPPGSSSASPPGSSSASPPGSSSASPPGSSSASPPGSSSASPPGSSSASPPGSSSASSSGPTNSPGSSTSGPTGTPQPGKTCANNPCRNSRPCYNTGNNYFCYCGSRYTGYDCETAL